MPRENFMALKAFVAVSRSAAKGQPEENTPALTKEQEKALRLLPKRVRGQLFAFIQSISGTRFFHPDGKPKPGWNVLHANTWEKARQEAVNMCGAAEADSVMVSRMYERHSEATKLVEKLKRTATLRAAKELAEEAIKRAAGDAAGDAVWCATLMAELICMSHLDVPDKEWLIAHAEARWEVWRKGYGLIVDDGDHFYVYCSQEQ